MNLQRLRWAVAAFLMSWFCFGAYTRTALAQQLATADLRKLSLEELGNIVVTTVTKEPEQVWRTAAAIYVLTADDIRRSGATSIPEALRLAPGLQVSRIDGSDWAVAVRGLAGQFSQSLLVLVDGRNVYTPLFAGVYWGVLDLPLEDIERIEIIRGPGGTIWGTNAVNGVINIITRSADQTRGVLASVSAGTLDHGIATVRFGGAVGDLSYRLFARSALRGAAHHPGSSAFDEWNLAQSGFRADWKVSGRDTLRLDGRLYTGNEGRLVEIGLYEPPSQIRVEDSEEVAGGHLGALYRRQMSPGSDLQLHLYYDRTSRLGVQYGERRHTLAADVLHSTAVKSHTLRWGLGARWSPGTFIQTIPTVEFSPSEQTERVVSVFGQDEISFASGRVRVLFGAKAEHNRYTGWETQPSATAIWRPSERHAFWVAGTHAIRIPSRLDRDLRLTGNAAPSPPTYLRIAGSADFDSEKLTSWAAGHRQLFTRRFYIDVAAFVNSYDDLSGFGSPTVFPESTPPPNRTVIQYQFVNGVEGQSRGIELSPSWIPTGWLELKGAYSFLELTLENKPGFTDPTNIANAQSRANSSPRHQGFIQSTVRLPRRVQLTQTFRAVGALTGQKVPAYQTLDLVGSWDVSQGFEVSLAGQNLLDANHPEFGGTPGLVGIPRSVYAKLVWRR
jgi:iron complex outermembrane recepter protein